MASQLAPSIPAPKDSPAETQDLNSNSMTGGNRDAYLQAAAPRSGYPSFPPLKGGTAQGEPTLPGEDKGATYEALKGRQGRGAQLPEV